MGVGEGEETEGAAVEAAMAEEACQSRKVSKAKGRFTHLLEPIRSLADNWSVDIACELEAYLEELEDLCCAEEEEVTQSTEGPADGGDDVVMEKKKFSFAKAALLVQGSTYVYSKKVSFSLKPQKKKLVFTFSLFSQAFGLTTRDVFSMIHLLPNHSCRFFSCLSLKGGVPLLVGRGVHREGVELGQEAGV